MSKIFSPAKKFALAALLLSIGLAFLPAASASAAPPALDEPPFNNAVNTTRLEEIYSKLNEWYTQQTAWMDKAEANIARIQTMIDKAAQHGFDTTALQAALDAFGADYPEARPYNLQAAEILAVHAGFDDSGHVTDQEQAIETLRALQTALNTAYETMGGENHTGKALIEAVKAFIEAIRPNPAP